MVAVDRDVRSGDAQQQDGANDADDDRGSSGAGEIRVVGFDLSELDPPTDAHKRDSEAEEPETEVADHPEERDEHYSQEGEQHPGHDLEVAGVAAGLADAARGGGRGFGGDGVDGRGAVRALAVRGVDGFLAVRAREDFDLG